METKLKVFCCLLIVMIGLSITACSNHSDVQDNPVILLSEDRMTDLLYDTQIIEAYLTYKRSVGQNITFEKESLYNQVFKHYGINESLFTSNLNYYNLNSENMERLMKEVVRRIKNDQETLKSQLNDSISGKE